MISKELRDFMIDFRQSAGWEYMDKEANRWIADLHAMLEVAPEKELQKIQGEIAGIKRFLLKVKELTKHNL